MLLSCKSNTSNIQQWKGTKNIDEFQFVYLSGKAKVSYQDAKQNFKSSVDIRIKKDSAIWLSFRPAMGIEAMRVLITQDSMKIIDRLKSENYAYSLRELSRNIQFNLDFVLFQAAITGNLISKTKIDSTYQNTDFQVVTQKNNAIFLQTHIHKNNRKIYKVKLQDVVTQNQGQVNYADFTEYDKQLFAFSCTMVLQYYAQNNMPQNAEMSLKYSKIEVSKKPLRFPF